MQYVRVKTLKSAGWRAAWHTTHTSRFDSKRFKTENAELYGEYTVRGYSFAPGANPV